MELDEKVFEELFDEEKVEDEDLDKIEPEDEPEDEPDEEPDEDLDDGVEDEEVEDEEDEEDEEDDEEYDVDDIKILPKSLRKSLKGLDKEDRTKLVAWIDERLEKARKLGNQVKDYEAKIEAVQKEIEEVNKGVGEFVKELGKRLKATEKMEEKDIEELKELLLNTYGKGLVGGIQHMFLKTLQRYREDIDSELRKAGFKPDKWYEKHKEETTAIVYLLMSGMKPVDVFRVVRIGKRRSNKTAVDRKRKTKKRGPKNWLDDIDFSKTTV